MLDRQVDILSRDLVRLVGELAHIHGELVMHMRSKLEAIKQADSDRVQSITAREMTLAGQIEERNGLRRQLVRKIGAALKLEEEGIESMRFSVLAEYLAEPRRSQLLVASAGLKEKVEEFERLRVTTTLITQEMLKHMQSVMEVITAGIGGASGYGSRGQRSTAATSGLFEAVG